MALFHKANKLAIQEECEMIPLAYARVTARSTLGAWLGGMGRAEVMALLPRTNDRRAVTAVLGRGLAAS